MAKKLFSPTTLGDVELPNRVVMAPMTRSRATADHVPTEIMADYYAQRAGAGLIITEGTAPDANGVGYPRIPGLYNDAQVEGWRRVTDAVHAEGSKIAVQFMHTGRISHPLNMPESATVLAPSAIRASGEMYTDQEGPQPHPVPAAMTEAQIEETISGFASSAKRAREAGFDMVELHGANGYLIEQFIAPNANKRDDRWGGSIEGRGRFAVEVARRVSDAIGASRVGIRLSPHGVFNDIQPWEGVREDYAWLAAEFAKLGLAYIHIVDHAAMGAPPVPEESKAAIRNGFGGAIILSGGYDVDGAEKDLQDGKGEAVAFARKFLANPDLVARLKQGAALNEPDQDTFYTPGPKGYTDYPAL